ncbi:hypothetical protein Y1Q_0023218 [Alligator mississippiensis]|uniref:Secreted protein n=1 Tax=Alligator mississippiensis TaxID=8496 RepID=A0A151MJF4_ALLMI|nr:hypothetical protein Y1Q_0023218 [Alligator mississippiensis]
MKTAHVVLAVFILPYIRFLGYDPEFCRRSVKLLRAAWPTKSSAAINTHLSTRRADHASLLEVSQVCSKG